MGLQNYILVAIAFFCVGMLFSFFHKGAHSSKILGLFMSMAVFFLALQVVTKLKLPTDVTVGSAAAAAIFFFFAFYVFSGKKKKKKKK